MNIHFIRYDKISSDKFKQVVLCENKFLDQTH